MKRSAVHVARSLRAMGDEATVVGPLSDGDPGRGFQGFGGVVNVPANGASNRMALLTLEAMACARPIVCSDIPGYRQVVDPGGSRLVPPGDAAQIAGAIAELARQPELPAGA